MIIFVENKNLFKTQTFWFVCPIPDLPVWKPHPWQRYIPTGMFVYTLYIAFIHVWHFLHPHGLQGFFSTLLSETKYCACFIKIAIRVTILSLFTRGQEQKKFYSLCPCRVLFFHFNYCVSIFIEHKDEIYEEDLKEGWTFLGRKKVHIVFIVVFVVVLFKWSVPVCHLYYNTITLVQTNPLKFHAWEASEAKFSRNSPELVHVMGSYKHASRHVRKYPRCLRLLWKWQSV